jgi:hypothetical protein
MYTPEEVSDFTPKGGSVPEFAESAEVFAETQETAQEATQVENHAEVPQAEETAAQRTETAQDAVEAEEVDSDTRNFLNAMKGLAKKNSKAYMDAMGRLGFESAGDVPAERRQAIYTAVNNAVVGATKEG